MLAGSGVSWRWGRRALLAAALVLWLAGTAFAGWQLSTGDVVPGFGAVGAGGVELLGVGDDDSVLIRGRLSDGRRGIFRARDHQLETIWSNDQTPGVQIEEWAAAVAANGAAAVPAILPGNPPRYLYYLALPDRPLRTTAPPAFDDAGRVLCGFDFRDIEINRHGDMMLVARFGPADEPCGDRSEEVVLRQSDGEWSVAVDTDRLPDFAHSLQRLALTDAGEILVAYVTTLGDHRVVGFLGSQLREIVTPGATAATGGVIDSIDRIVANAAGDVAFTAYSGGTDGLYRVDGDQILEVAPFGSGTVAGVSGDGDIVLVDDRTIAVYRADGGREVLFEGGRNSGLGYYAAPTGEVAVGADGTVAFVVWTVDGTAERIVFTATSDGLHAAIATGDPGPDGTIVAAEGLPWWPADTCVGPGGQLASTVTGVSGHQGLICVDADGPHLIARSGDPAPNGEDFRDFSQCSFTDDGGIVFSGNRVVPWERSQVPTNESAAYLATDTGIETLVEDFAPISNGQQLEDAGSHLRFIANRRGDILVQNLDGSFLHHDGVLDPLRYGELTAEVGLTDDGTVVAVSRVYDPDFNSVRGAGNIIVTLVEGLELDRITVADLPIRQDQFGGFTDLRVRGDRVWFALQERWGQKRLFGYRLGESPREILGVDAESVTGVASDGTVLEAVAGGFRTIDAAGRAGAVTVGSPLALNERGMIASLQTDARSVDQSRTTIAVSGPPADANARCPRVGSLPAVPPTATPTPAPLTAEGSYRVYIVEAGNDTLTAVDGESHQRLRSLVVSHQPTALAVSPQGDRIFVLAAGRVDVVEASSLRRIASLALGENGEQIFVSADGRRAYVSVSVSREGHGRLIEVDVDGGRVRSLLVRDRVTVFAMAGDGQWLGSTRGGACSGGACLVAVDPTSGRTTRTLAVGDSIQAAVVSRDGSRAYLADAQSNRLVIVDLATFTIIGEQPIGESLTDFVIADDGSVGFGAHSAVHWDGADRQGFLSRIGLDTATSTWLPIGLDQLRTVALSPDGRVVYVSGYGFVAAVDTASGELIDRIPVNLRAFDVAVGRLPGAPLPTPQASDAAIVRAEPAAGAAGDENALVVSFDPGGQAVQSLSFEWITTWAAPLSGLAQGIADCVLDPQIAATASFTHDDPSCAILCDRTRVRIEMKDPGAILPATAALARCWVRPTAPRGVRPVILTDASAADPNGEPVPVIAADGELRVVDQYQATPPPARTPQNGPTRTAVPPTSTPQAAMLEVSVPDIGAGERGTLTVRLQASAGAVRGLQNDIELAAGIKVVARAGGQPACRVNPAIGREATRFGFLPEGCDPAIEGDCASVRAIVVSFEETGPIADGSVLYDCDIEVGVAVAAGDYPLHLSHMVAAGPDAQRLPLSAADGVLRVTARQSVPATATAILELSPTATPQPASPSTTPTEVTDIPLPQTNESASASGCAFDAHGGSSGWTAALLLLPLAIRRRR